MTQKTVVRLTLAVSLLAGLSACCPVPESFFTMGDSVICRTAVFPRADGQTERRHVICESFEGGRPSRGHTSGVGEG